jgi:hypothetical protein
MGLGLSALVSNMEVCHTWWGGGVAKKVTVAWAPRAMGDACHLREKLGSPSIGGSGRLQPPE